MQMIRIQETIGVFIVVIMLAASAAVLWAGVGGAVGCSLAGVLIGVLLVITEKNSQNHR